MLFTDCQDASCLFSTYAPYVGGALALGLGTAILAPIVLPSAAVSASVYGVGAETIIAVGAAAI